MAKPILTQAYLNEILDYDKETGIFTWKPRDKKYFRHEGYWRAWNSQHAGKVAGFPNSLGYLVTSILRRQEFLHRLAFIHVEGVAPKQVDHINGAITDNRWINLRPTDVQGNQRNCKLRKDNKSGFTGVKHIPTSGRWSALIVVDQKTIHLGNFVDKEAAIEARKVANTKYGFHENHGRGHDYHKA